MCAVSGGLGNTALHWAAAKDNLTIVAFLLENGADVRVKNSSGDTALDSAVKNHASTGVTAVLDRARARARSPKARLEEPRLELRDSSSPSSTPGTGQQSTASMDGRQPAVRVAAQQRAPGSNATPSAVAALVEVEEGLPPDGLGIGLALDAHSSQSLDESSDFKSLASTDADVDADAGERPTQMRPPPVPAAAMGPHQSRAATASVARQQQQENATGDAIASDADSQRLKAAQGRGRRGSVELSPVQQAEGATASAAADSQRLAAAQTRKRRGSVEMSPIQPAEGAFDSDAERREQLLELVRLEHGMTTAQLPDALLAKAANTDHRGPTEKPRSNQLRVRCATVIASRMRGRKERRDYQMMRRVSRALQVSLREKWIRQLESGGPQAGMRLGDPANLRNGTNVADYGKIHFPTGGMNTSPFVRVDDKCPGEKLAAMMMYHWRFGTKNLRVMISVIGSSFDDVDLPISTQSAVSTGLTAFARNVSAIVVSSGLDQGVSKLIGKSAEALAGDDAVPFVGIAPWDDVMGNRTLRANALGAMDTHVVEYNSDVGAIENTDTAAPLEEHHSHFIFVDSRNKHHAGRYNSERPVRSKLESCFVALRKIPLMVFVIGGGVGTLYAVSQALRASNPVVLVEGSGGIADAIASIISSGSFSRCKDTLAELLPEQGQAQEIKRLKADLLQGIDERLITVFNASMVEKGHGVEEVMMQSMLMRLKFRPLKKLTLAIQWGQVDVVDHLLGRFKHDRRLYKRMLDFCLRKAIFCRRAEIVETMLTRGVEVDRQYGTSMDHGLRLTVRELYGLGGQSEMAKDIQKRILKLRADEVTMRTQESVLGISRDIGELSVATATAVKLAAARWLAKTRASKAAAETRRSTSEVASQAEASAQQSRTRVRRGSVDRLLAIGQSSLDLGKSMIGMSMDAMEAEQEPESVSEGWQCALCTQTCYGGAWICEHCPVGTRGLEVAAPGNCTLLCYMKPVEWLNSPFTSRTVKSHTDEAAMGTIDSPHVRSGKPQARRVPRRRRTGARNRTKTLAKAEGSFALRSTDMSTTLHDADHLEYPQPVIDALKELMPQFDPNYVQCESRPMIGAIDIMLWACFNNDAPMAEIFWRRCKSPIEAGLVGSVLCKNLSCVPDLDSATAKGLVNLAVRLELLAKEVLGECASVQDAAKILRRKSEYWKVTAMELALDDRNTAGVDASALDVGPSDFLGGSAEQDEDDDEDWQETFLAHRYCGPVLYAVWCGDYLQNNEDSLIAYIQVLVQVFVPFRQLVATHPRMPWLYSRFLRVPKVKFIVYYAAYMGFLTVYVLVLANRWISWLDFVLTVWVFGLSLNEALDYRGSGGTHFDDFWNIIDAVFLGVIHIAMSMRCTVITGFGACGPAYILLTGSLLAAQAPTRRDVAKATAVSAVGAYLIGMPFSDLVLPPAETLLLVETISFKLLSCNVILAFVRLFTVLMASGPTGVLVIIIVRMCNEKTGAFMIMITALGCSFAVALAGLELLANNSADQGGLSITGFIFATLDNLVQLVWALVGDLETSEEEQSEWTSQAMLWVYMLVVQLLLANGVLIALLTDTYEAVRDRAYGEQVLSRLDLLHEFVGKHWLPPPLTLPFVAAEHLGWGEEGKFAEWVKSVTTRKLDVELHPIDPRVAGAQQLGMGGVNTSGSLMTETGAAADAVESQALARFLRGCAPVARGRDGDDGSSSLDTRVDTIANQITAMQEQLSELASRLPSRAIAAGDGQ